MRTVQGEQEMQQILNGEREQEAELDILLSFYKLSLIKIGGVFYQKRLKSVYWSVG